MAEETTVVTGSDEVLYANDKVPDPYKFLFSNDEWVMHDIVVKSTYGFAVIAVISHTLVWLWQPWLVAGVQ